MVELRQVVGEAPVTLELLEATLGAEGVHELRRRYFPRWRPGRSHAAGESLRAFRTVIVEDAFEAEVVSALAPPNLKVSVRVDERVPKQVAETAPPAEVPARL